MKDVVNLGGLHIPDVSSPPSHNFLQLSPKISHWFIRPAIYPQASPKSSTLG